MKNCLLLSSIILLVASCNNTSTTSKSDLSIANTTPSVKSETSLWKYTLDTNKMTSKLVYYAWLDASQKVDLTPPYEGGSTATIGLEYIDGVNTFSFSVSKGNITCPSSNRVNLLLRFDNDSARYYTFGFPSDGRCNMIYTNYNMANDILNRLKKAKTLKVQVNYFRTGDIISEFNVAGLKWDHQGKVQPAE